MHTVREKLAQALAALFVETEAKKSEIYVYKDDFEDRLVPDGTAIKVTIEFVKVEDIGS